MTTNNNPDEIRRDIARTRAELSDNVNALADNANPANVARRQVDKVKDGVTDVKHRIFGDPNDPWDDGSAGGVRQQTQGAVEDARQAVQDAPGELRRRAEGNPLAAGLVAFGLGVLVAGLIPSSNAEQDLARQAKQKAEPLVDEAKAAAQEAADHLKPAAQQAADSLKETATAAGEHVKNEAQGAADDVKAQAQRSTDDVKGDERNPL